MVNYTKNRFSLTFCYMKYYYLCMKTLLDPVTKIDLAQALDQAFEAYDEKNRKYRDEILTGLDHIMKELETIREDNTIGTHQIRNLEEKTDNHEKRITKLESSPL